ncbi:DUF4129 domain-containing transglutaminase family protein [Thermodesulfobacteriota bacterium]
MNTPILLTGAAIIFWGWQTGLMVIAVIMALVLEGSRFISLRFEFSREDINRFSDLSSIIIVGILIYLLVVTRSAQAVLSLIKWMPLALLPLFIGQVYNLKDEIDISALFLIYRRKSKPLETRPVNINISYPYFALCILSASTSNSGTAEFYGGMFTLIVWALWSIRQKRFPIVLWIILLLFSGMIGYIGQYGLHQLQLSLERMAVTRFADLFSKDPDPYKIMTAIGDVGNLKLSDNILFRVKPETFKGQTILLRETSYKAYRKSMWFAPGALFKEIRPEENRSTWRIGKDMDDRGESIIIYQSLKKGRGMLKLPLNVYEINEFPVLKLTGNQYGAFKVEEGPGFIKFRVLSGKEAVLDSLPDEGDLHIPQEEAAAVLKTAGQLGLESLTPQEAVQSLLNYFGDNFIYTLVQKKHNSGATPLENFLLNSKKGHCEFFATATVLLLRAAGIPSRYAVGYSVQEFNDFENCFVVRARHAHAWTLVYVDGTWHNLDTTPASWITAEEENASFWEPMKDLISYILFKFKEWRWSEKETEPAKYLIWLIIPLAIFICHRFYSRKQFKKKKEKEECQEIVDVRKGINSPFYKIEKKLSQSGYSRRPAETLIRWLARLEAAQSQPTIFESLKPILTLHYRYRFDPEGITDDEILALRNDVQSWLDRYEERSGLS